MNYIQERLSKINAENIKETVIKNAVGGAIITSTLATEAEALPEPTRTEHKPKTNELAEDFLQEIKNHLDKTTKQEHLIIIRKLDANDIRNFPEKWGTTNVKGDLGVEVYIDNLPIDNILNIISITNEER